MAIIDRNTIKSWFKRGDKPTAQQFAAWIDSFFHKTDDTLPLSKVEGLADIVNNKFDKQTGELLAADFTAHKTDENAHEDIRELVFNEIEQIREEIENIIIGDIDEISSDEVDAITN